MDLQRIFAIADDVSFEAQCLLTFKHQYLYNSMYRRYCHLLGVGQHSVHSPEDIPFLPITFFKSNQIIATDEPVTHIFESSGTTGAVTSKHHVAHIEVYRKSYTLGFLHFYGAPKNYHILALLPSYIERPNSSLIYMVQGLIAESQSAYSGFYSEASSDFTKLLERLDQAKDGRKVLLIGVSFALLDLAENNSFRLSNTIIMETGGMKGRRKELIRKELHQILSKRFGVDSIHSEYGMTELLSQAYSNGQGVFRCPPWMQVRFRDTEDPLSYSIQSAGGVNIIDLANFYSCSFIATQDLGKPSENDTFEIIGRFDNSDIRGCNLLIS